MSSLNCIQCVYELCKPCFKGVSSIVMSLLNCIQCLYKLCLPCYKCVSPLFMSLLNCIQCVYKLCKPCFNCVFSIFISSPNCEHCNYLLCCHVLNASPLVSCRYSSVYVVCYVFSLAGPISGRRPLTGLLSHLQRCVTWC